MTRPSNSSLVLDGFEVKLRLMAERSSTKSAVHVDWVRFTTLLRNQPTLAADRLFPNVDYTSPDFRAYELQRALDSLPDPDFSPAAQALALAERTCEALGPDFSVNPAIGKGHDFYKCRWIIQRNETECGWVGFLTSGDSPRQESQAKTLHVNIFGAACIFAQTGWNSRIADLVDELDAKLTRADLALDFFNGYPGGIMAIFEGYRAGACDVSGRRLKSSCLGDWANGNSRSFYFGSRESGKITNCYEKGDQLFGPGVSAWLRAELRYGNKLRVLPSDVLRRPSDFFAGASDWHSHALSLVDKEAIPEKVKTIPRLALETVQAETYRVIKWAMSTAAPTLTALFHHLGDDALLQFLENKKLPGRLQKFSPSELTTAFTSAMGRFASQPECSPAFTSA